MAKIKEKRHKLKKSDFKYFRKRVLYWFRVLGCGDFGLDVEFGCTEFGEDALAEYCADGESMGIVIRLNRYPDEVLTRKDLDRIAFHEVFEGCYLCELRWMSGFSFSDGVIDRETHRVVRRAENFIFERLR